MPRRISGLLMLLSLALLWVLRDVVVLAAFAVVLAYVLLPLANAVQRVPLPGGRRLSRPLAAVVVMATLAVIVSGTAAIALPRLAADAARFAAVVPGAAAGMLDGLRAEVVRHGLAVGPALDGIREHAGDWLARATSALTGLVGGMFGGMSRLVELALVPLLAFYLLADSSAVEASALRFVPESARPTLLTLRGAVERALRSYVRGQAIVCLIMGVVVGAGLAAIHHPAALLLGVLVGTAEILPYVGFAVAAATIALAGWTVSPLQAALGVGLYVAVNWVIGTFVTPRVMGRYLEMHPFVVTLSVLAGAQLIGPAGALLALPFAASLQAAMADLVPQPTPAAAPARQEVSAMTIATRQVAAILLLAFAATRANAAAGALPALTPPPSPPCTRPAGALLADDFSEPQLAGWNADRAGVWSVQGGLLCASLPDGRQLHSFLYAGDSTWVDYAVDFDVCGIRGVDKGCAVRVTPAKKGLGVDLRGPGYDDLKLYLMQFPVGSAPVPNANGGWHHLRIEIRGRDRCTVAADGGTVLDCRVHPPAPARGGIALSAYTGGIGSCTVYYDNVVVTPLAQSAAISR